MEPTRAQPSQRIRESIAFPLSRHGQPWLAAVTAAGAIIELLGNLPIPFAFLLALILRVLLWVLVYRIASEILLSAAEGDSGAPGTRSTESADGLAVRHIGLWLLATAVVVAAAAQAGAVGAALASVAVAVVLPAATILLTLSRSLVDALIPTQWARLAGRVGWRDYGDLFSLLVLASIGYLGIESGLRALDIGPGIRNVVQMGYWSFAVFAWFHLAGRTVHRRRSELNLVEPDTEPERPPERFTRDAETLMRQIRERGGTVEMHAELARQLERASDREARLAHAQIHLPALLLSFERPDEALDRADRMLAVDADFCLEQPAQMRALIDAAVQREAPRLAARLCRNYLTRFPDSAKADDVRLTGCEALAHDVSSLRNLGERWFRELMTRELDDELRGRLQRVAPNYLDSSGRSE